MPPFLCITKYLREAPPTFWTFLVHILLQSVPPHHLRAVRHPFITKRTLFFLDILFRATLLLFIAGCARRPAF